MMEISTVFVNFWPNQIPNFLDKSESDFVQIKKMKEGVFSFQLKKKILLQTSTDARLKNVPLPLI